MTSLPSAYTCILIALILTLFDLTLCLSILNVKSSVHVIRVSLWSLTRKSETLPHASASSLSVPVLFALLVTFVVFALLFTVYDCVDVRWLRSRIATAHCSELFVVVVCKIGRAHV